MAEAKQKKLVREYETIYLLRAETPDDQVEEIKERLRGVVSREGGKVIRFTNQGKRKTAFPVSKNQKALYMHVLYVGNPGLVGELERNLKMIDSITKFQSVKVAPAEAEKPREERGEGAGDETFEAEAAEQTEER